MSLVIIKGTWHDHLIWCPSQCNLVIKHQSKDYEIYLRWRHSDPWTAHLIDMSNQDETLGWTMLNVPFFKQLDDLDEIKQAAFDAAVQHLGGQVNGNTATARRNAEGVEDGGQTYEEATAETAN
jgi:23S rRNA A1618 N6-methylase RlmF